MKKLFAAVLIVAASYSMDSHAMMRRFTPKKDYTFAKKVFKNSFRAALGVGILYNVFDIMVMYDANKRLEDPKIKSVEYQFSLGNIMRLDVEVLDEKVESDKKDSKKAK